MKKKISLQGVHIFLRLHAQGPFFLKNLRHWETRQLSTDDFQILVYSMRQAVIDTFGHPYILKLNI